MSSLREKLERVHSLLINEENEQAEALFHEAFVEAAREIHKKVMEEEDWLNDEEVDEDFDISVANDEIDAEEQNENYLSADDMISETDEVWSQDIEGMVAEGMDPDSIVAAMESQYGPDGSVFASSYLGLGEAGDGVEDEEGFGDEVGDEGPVDDLEGDLEGEGDLGDRIADLESELEALKAEFEELEGGDDDDDGEELGDEDFGDEEPTEEGYDEDVYEGEEALASKKGGSPDPAYNNDGATLNDRRTFKTGSGATAKVAADRREVKDDDGIYEEDEDDSDEVDAIEESFELEPVTVKRMGDGEYVGAAGAFGGKGPTRSPTPGTPAAKRQLTDIKQVDVNKGVTAKPDYVGTPSADKFGYDKAKKRKNVRDHALEDMETVPTPGDSNALIDTTEKEFGKDKSKPSQLVMKRT